MHTYLMYWNYGPKTLSRILGSMPLVLNQPSKLKFLYNYSREYRGNNF